MSQAHFQPPLPRFAQFNVPWYRLNAHVYKLLQSNVGPAHQAELELVIYELLNAGTHFYVVEQMLGSWISGYKRKDLKKYIKWSVTKIKRHRQEYNLPDPPTDKAEQFYCRLLYAFGFDTFQGSLEDLAKEFQLEPETLRRYLRLLRQRQQLQVSSTRNNRTYELIQPTYQFSPEEENDVQQFYIRILTRYGTTPFSSSSTVLAKEFDMSPYTVQSYLKLLRQQRLLTVLLRRREVSLYQLHRVCTGPEQTLPTLSVRASHVYRALRAARGVNTVFAAGYSELRELTGVTTNTLRAAFTELEQQGYLWRQVGRGSVVSQYLLYDVEP